MEGRVSTSVKTVDLTCLGGEITWAVVQVNSLEYLNLTLPDSTPRRAGVRILKAQGAQTFT